MAERVTTRLRPPVVVDHRVGPGATAVAVICGWLLATRQSIVVPFSLGLTPVAIAWYAAGVALFLCWLSGQRIAAPHRGTVLLVMGTMLATLVSSAALMVRGPVGGEAGNSLLLIARDTGLLAAVIFILVVVRSTAALTRVVQGIVIGAAVSASLAIAHALTGLDISSALILPGLTDQAAGTSPVDLVRAGAVRPQGSAGHPLELSGLLTVCFPLALGLSFAQRERQLPHVRWAVLSGLIALGAVVTISRSAVVGLIAALVVMSWRWPVRRVLMGGLALSVAVGVAVMGGVGIAARLASVLVEGSSDGSIGSRTSGLSYALGGLADHWLVGQGAGTYDVSRQPVLDNFYLTLLVESGVIGLLCMLLMLCGAWVFSFRASRRALASADSGAFELINGILGAVMAIMVVGLVLDMGGFAQITNLQYVLVALAGVAAMATRPGAGDVDV